MSKKTDTIFEQAKSGNLSFAFYRLPEEKDVKYILSENEAVRTYAQIHIAEDEEGFLIAPFNISEECPFVFIPGEEKTMDLPPDLPAENKNSGTKENITADYKLRFEMFTKALKEEKLKKIVLSRATSLQRPKSFCPFKTFLQACRNYKTSYIFLYHTPQTGTWLGSTPEALLSGKNNQYQTTALAGTQLIKDGKIPENWDEKNKKEQQLVAKHIRKQLKEMNITPTEKEAYSVKAGNLAHLKSDFFFSLPPNISTSNLLQQLHPTPAVCGYPKEEALQFIIEHEGYNRRYYSGFLGRRNPNKNTDLYMNIRCMEIKKQHLILYAGGGLLPNSKIEEEWQETENKMQTKFLMIND